ncbi:hypothetical protein MKW94_013514 [Papaver nudicaule]|uniref:Uncharacterized protein n=1 Tax=Papaver nudicaule TaxID=74823 RepID=A0AA41S8M5_PAPNU|nr:hypothetical protein [Papaver nudicaule]
MCSLEKCGNIFTLTLTGDDEHRLNPTLIESIRVALKQVCENAKPGSVLITTAICCSYLDLVRVLVADLFSLAMPTVAVVTGQAVAAGFLVALSHDYVLTRKDRGVLYMSELNIGLPLYEIKDSVFQGRPVFSSKRHMVCRVDLLFLISICATFSEHFQTLAHRKKGLNKFEILGCKGVEDVL